MEFPPVVINRCVHRCVYASTIVELLANKHCVIVIHTNTCKSLILKCFYAKIS